MGSRRKYTKKGVLEIPTDMELLKDIIFEQWVATEETAVLMFDTENFGYTHVPEETVDVRGFVIPRKLFRV